MVGHATLLAACLGDVSLVVANGIIVMAMLIKDAVAEDGKTITDGDEVMIGITIAEPLKNGSVGTEFTIKVPIAKASFVVKLVITVVHDCNVIGENEVNNGDAVHSTYSVP